MKQVYQAICILGLVALASTACTVNLSEKVDVSAGNRTDLHFTDRGSAAGIMMDAYMGGAGIAIDEGIAKETANALRASNPDFSITTLVKNVLVEQAK